MSALHDDEILGKAYDARLMRRLLAYLRPYWREVGVALIAIVIGALAQLAQPYLIKIAIDRHIATGQPAGLDRLAEVYLLILIVAYQTPFSSVALSSVWVVSFLSTPAILWLTSRSPRAWPGGKSLRDASERKMSA